tara:strand:+ start:976 stop:1236 length:261 start_codon:yes stop_codon:yes gene_type:complete
MKSPRIYCSMFDQVWSMNFNTYLDLLNEVATTGCIEDMDNYGKILSYATSQRYLKDWSKTVICVLDMTAEMAQSEIEYYYQSDAVD